MANILLENATKEYNKGTVIAVDSLTIECKDRELVAILGPSGAGKSSTLKMICGIEDITEGKLFIDGKEATDLAPQDRNISMVFENYAIYPHLTVKDNLMFPLEAPQRVKKWSKDEKEKIVLEWATRVGLANLLDRKPSQLSGGQRQRVSLARALVRSPEPNVILMDEPIAHLDAKLRNSMRAELKRLQKDLGATIIYVTHDYLEAMGLADKIIVIREGKMVQQGTPKEIYSNPINEFVATTVGDPPMNFINGELSEKDGEVIFSFRKQQLCLSQKPSVMGNVDIGIRPSQVVVAKDKKGDNYLKGKVQIILSTGAKQIMDVNIDGRILRVKVPRTLDYQLEDIIYLYPEVENICLFDAKDKSRIDFKSEVD